MKLTARSIERLVGVHADLQRVVQRAAVLIGDSPPDGAGFIVTEGLRTLALQQSLVRSGASRTTKSRHLDGHAVDLACTVLGVVRWDWPLYKNLADLVKQAAALEGVPIEWGGDWATFKDGPHFQLPWAAYPSKT